MGGSAFQLSGCDPDVRATLLTGLHQTTTGLSATLITAFFQSLADDDDASAVGGSGSGTTN
jgi:hypothetical protein